MTYGAESSNADADASVLLIDDRRFARFEAIKWWDQTRLRAAKVLVVGAGALGNEVIKNLCLLGVGHLAVIDMDHIELSNLSRSVLFREADKGRPKAEVAAQRAGELYPEVKTHALVGNLLADVGLGWFGWADMVVGALDNREARLFTNQACARWGRPWIDGGIDVLNGIVRIFAPPQSACYECTMGQRDWQVLDERRSCSLLARRAMQEGGVPTTPTTASVVGAMQAQEIVKHLHGMETLAGRGYVFEGAMHNSYAVTYSVSPTCPWHEAPPPIEPVQAFGRTTPLLEIGQWARQRLGDLDAVDFSREIVRTLTCPDCGGIREVWMPIDRIDETQAVCKACGGECAPQFVHSVSADDDLWDRTVGQLGLPAWDVVWARSGADEIGIELAGDRPADASTGR